MNEICWFRHSDVPYVWIFRSGYGHWTHNNRGPVILWFQIQSLVFKEWLIQYFRNEISEQMNESKLQTDMILINVSLAWIMRCNWNESNLWKAIVFKGDHIKFNLFHWALKEISPLTELHYLDYVMGSRSLGIFTIKGMKLCPYLSLRWE